MKFKIQKEERNSLLKRLDLEVIIDHEGGATPSKESIRRKLSTEKDWDLNRIEVKFIHSIYGSPFSKGIIKVWDESQERLKLKEEIVEVAKEEEKTSAIEEKNKETPAEEKVETIEKTSVEEKTAVIAKENPSNEKIKKTAKEELKVEETEKPEENTEAI